MIERHNVRAGFGIPGGVPRLTMRGPVEIQKRPLTLGDLARFVAGTDVSSRQSDDTTIADQYRRLGVRMNPANTDRVNGWAEILQCFGDPEAGVRPTLFIHKRCRRLLECIAALQHDPSRPEDVLKVDTDDGVVGGDDAADALRYLLDTKPRTVHVLKIKGL